MFLKAGRFVQGQGTTNDASDCSPELAAIRGHRSDRQRQYRDVFLPTLGSGFQPVCE
jgi:hypothetical protein